MFPPPHPVVAVDVMGSDRGPQETFEGILLALRRCREANFSLILVGNRELMANLLAGKRFRPFRDRIRLHHAAAVIAMDESPMRAMRQRESSMGQAIDLVREGEAGGALTCGNTGALVAIGTIRLRPMPQLERPALATVIPGIDRHFVLLDVGANPSPTPRQLVHNAILGAHYNRVALQNPSPRVGLLSIGTEEGKGNGLVQQTHEMLKKLGGIIRYEGLVEGFQLFQDPPDVVVCDGFVGNVLLKTMESLARRLKGFIGKELFRNPLRIFGCLFAAGALRTIRKKLSAEAYGGAPLLGLNGSLFKAHGSSDRDEICRAILMAERFLRESCCDRLRDQILRSHTLLSETTEGN
ncbi:MAG: phosphate acyltransferase PlsX [Puniceicoccales bacterium]|jgi:glycerol-3-phosphate acyltransferase PlsX|nr:phosphate acyltransferase PlsX [Puniceicoccales bacterium]